MREEIRKIKLKASLICCALALFPGVIPAFSQTAPKTAVNIKKTIVNQTTAEKSIAVDAKVNIKICVAEGNLKINGWERNEIRAYVAGGSRAVDF